MGVVAGDVAAPCDIRHTIVEEENLGGRIAAMFICEEGVVAVVYDPSVVRGSQLGLLRLWWRRSVVLGFAFRIYWAADIGACLS